MRSALPEEIEKILHQNLISDSTLTLPHIQSCLEDMMYGMEISTTDVPTNSSSQALIYLWFNAPELGHSLIDDNHERPLHPLVVPFLRDYLSRPDDMDVDDDEMGHLYTGANDTGDTRYLARSMLEDWEGEKGVEQDQNGNMLPNPNSQRSRKRFSTPDTARDPSKIEETELECEDLQEMIYHLPRIGAVRFHHAPESMDTSHAGVTATTFQGTTSVITARGPYQLEGARWHLLTKVFSNELFFQADLQSEIYQQEHLDDNPKYG